MITKLVVRWIAQMISATIGIDAWLIYSNADRPSRRFSPRSRQALIDPLGQGGDIRIL